MHVYTFSQSTATKGSVTVCDVAVAPLPTAFTRQLTVPLLGDSRHLKVWPCLGFFFFRTIFASLQSLYRSFVVKRKPSVKVKDHRYKKQKYAGEKLRVE